MLWESARWLEDQVERVGGTGSISCRSLTAEEAEEALERRGPIGFRVREPELVEQGTWNGIPMLLEVKDWGEGEWTARDLR